MIGYEAIKSTVDKYDSQIDGLIDNISFDQASHFARASTSSIAWVQSGDQTTNANLVITSPETKISGAEVVIRTENSKGLFADLVNEFLVPKNQGGIHPSAVIDPEANIHPDAYVGPNCVIGKAEIGAGTVLDGNIFVYDNVKIGQIVRIAAGAVIGAQGSGLVKNSEQNWIPFPQMGGVILEDFVSVGANSYIARGALQDTVIGAHTHIGLSCCVAHNVRIGSNTLLLANSVICGSAIIGSDVWISPGSSIMNKVTIGDGAMVGQGSNVVKDVAPQAKVYGNPAKAK